MQMRKASGFPAAFFLCLVVGCVLFRGSSLTACLLAPARQVFGRERVEEGHQVHVERHAVDLTRRPHAAPQVDRHVRERVGTHLRDLAPRLAAKAQPSNPFTASLPQQVLYDRGMPRPLAAVTSHLVVVSLFPY